MKGWCLVAAVCALAGPGRAAATNGAPAAAETRAQEIGAFWEQTLARLAREPMEAVCEKVNEPLPYQKYRVTLHGLNGVKFRAWLALPVAGERVTPGRWPAIVTTPGYGGTQQGVMLSECQRGYAVLQVFPRGQGDSAEFFAVDVVGKLTANLDQPEGAYYQGALADVVRAIDFLATCPEVDATRIALVGTSQGGGISLAVAAIDPRVKAVVAHVPFLCNFRLAARTPSLVKKLLDDAGRNDEAALRTLDFFDPWQLAPRLHAPVLLSAGGKDTVCPAATIRSVSERLPGPHTLLEYPELTHTSCTAFYNATWEWLDRNFRGR